MRGIIRVTPLWDDKWVAHGGAARRIIRVTPPWDDSLVVLRKAHRKDRAGTMVPARGPEGGHA